MNGLAPVRLIRMKPWPLDKLNYCRRSVIRVKLVPGGRCRDENMKGHSLIVWLALLPATALLAGGDANPICDVPDREVRVVKRVTPPYPLAAQDHCIEGHAKFQYTIGVDGVAKNIMVVESDPDDIFNEAGHILKLWEFRPRCVDGEPVEHTATIIMDFELNGPANNCPENLPAEFLELTIALTAVHSEFNRQTRSRARTPVDLPLESNLDEPFASIELAHRRFVNARLDLGRAWRDAPWDLIHRTATPENWPDADAARAARARLADLIEKRNAIRQRWPQAIQQIEDDLKQIDEAFELTDDLRWVVLEGQPEASREMLEQHEQVVEIEQSLYHLYLEQVDWFISREQDWAAEAGGLAFASSSLEHEYQRRLDEIKRLERELFENYLVPEAILSSGF